MYSISFGNTLAYLFTFPFTRTAVTDSSLSLVQLLRLCCTAFSCVSFSVTSTIYSSATSRYSVIGAILMPAHLFICNDWIQMRDVGFSILEAILVLDSNQHLCHIVNTAKNSWIVPCDSNIQNYYMLTKL